MYYIKIISVISIFFFSTIRICNATDYFVSMKGNDANSGTSESLSWRSLGKVNNFNFLPGDKVFFRRGDEWEGTITCNYSGKSGNPIVYGAYGTGGKPKIYGSTEVNGWILHSENIYKAPFDNTINQLFFDASRMQAARYPNNGYFLISSVQSSTQFTCNDLNSGIDYTGAKWFGRTGTWTADLKNVTTSTSGTLTVNSAPRYGLNRNEGFFLMNKLEFLDSPNQWYYDDEEKMVYLWTPNGDSPTDHIIRASVLDNGVVINGKHYVSIQELNILHQSGKGIYIANSDYITLNENDISYPDGYGIYDISESHNLSITNNTVTGANHYGMNIRISNSTISDNVISQIAVFDEIGLTGTGRDNYGGGIYLAGAEGNNIVRYNRIAETAYHGIYWSKPNNLIEYNFINHACLWKGDGGGIYAAWSNHSLPGTTGSVVRNNIVLNVTGSVNGYTASHAYGEGIYIDEAAEDVTVENNTVAHCSDGGIFLHDNAGTEAMNNTIFDVRYGVLISSDHGSNSVHDNIIYSLDEDDYEPNQLLVKRNSSANTTFNSNTYINHYNSSSLFKISEQYFNFNEWKSVTEQDAISTIDLSSMGAGEIEELFYNDTKETININLEGSGYRDLNGSEVLSNLSLGSFESRILIKDNQSSDSIPPVITSFIIPLSSESLTIPINTFIATDDQTVSGYILTESPDTPLAGSGGWNSNAPKSYTFSQEGSMTLYAWVKDAAGNISDSQSGVVVITLPQIATAFSEYLFEETSGDIIIDSNGSNNGHIINDEFRVDGVNGKGLEFTGTNYIDLAQCFGDNVKRELTLSIWLKPTAMLGGNQGVIMHGGPNTDSFALYIKPDNKSIGFKTGGTTSDWISVENVEELWDGDWHHLTTTYNGSKKMIYLDGVVILTRDATGEIDSGGGYNLLIGAGRDESPPRLFYKGLIDEVRIYNYALTPSEINELYNKIVTAAITFVNPQGINEYLLFPNPSKTSINVIYFQYPELETRIKIYSNTGKLILDRLVEHTTNSIDISNFSSGIYFLRSVSVERSTCKKFVVE